MLLLLLSSSSSHQFVVILGYCRNILSESMFRKQQIINLRSFMHKSHGDDGKLIEFQILRIILHGILVKTIKMEMYYFIWRYPNLFLFDHFVWFLNISSEFRALQWHCLLCKKIQKQLLILTRKIGNWKTYWEFFFKMQKMSNNQKLFYKTKRLTEKNFI